jgi:hypothetical protein
MAQLIKSFSLRGKNPLLLEVRGQKTQGFLTSDYMMD